MQAMLSDPNIQSIDEGSRFNSEFIQYLERVANQGVSKRRAYFTCADSGRAGSCASVGCQGILEEGYAPCFSLALYTVVLTVMVPVF